MKLAIDVDRGAYYAGEPISGHVYFECKNENEIPAIQHRLQISLKGEERTCIHTKTRPTESEDRKTDLSSRELRTVRRSNVLFLSVLDVKFGVRRVANSLCELPFLATLPSMIPASSLRFSRMNNYGKMDVGEIAYQAVVSLDSRSSDTPIQMFSVMPTPPKNPLATEMQSFSIMSSLFWKQGKIMFGFETDTDFGVPDAIVTVRIQHDDSQSKVKVRDFLVRWLQTIKFWTPSTRETDRAEIKDEMVLVQESVIAKPNGEAVVCSLQLPKSGYTSFSGKSLNIYHSLSVKAQTGKPRTTNPELSIHVRWQNKVFS